MTKAEFKLFLQSISNNDLYLLARKYFLLETLGIKLIEWKFQMIGDECNNRKLNSAIQSALDDSIYIASIIKDNCLRFIPKLKRIDMLNDDELSGLLSGLKKQPVTQSEEILNNSFFEKIPGLFIFKIEDKTFECKEFRLGDYLIIDCMCLIREGDMIFSMMNNDCKFLRVMESGDYYNLMSLTKEEQFRIIKSELHNIGVVKYIVKK